MKIKNIQVVPLLLLCTITCIIVSMYVTNDGDVLYDNLSRQLALITILLCLAPSFHYLISLSKPKTALPIPFMPILGFMYMYYYCIPILQNKALYFRSYPVAQMFIEESAIYSFLGWVCILIGYLFLGRVLAIKKRVYFSLDNVRRPDQVAIRMIFIGLAATVLGKLSIAGSLKTPLGVVSSFAEAGLGILLYLGLTRKLSFRNKSMKYTTYSSILIYCLFKMISSGLLSQMIFPLMILGFVYWSIRFKLPWIFLCIAIPCVILIKGAMGDFRDHMRTYGKVEGVVERSQIYYDIVVDKVADQGLGNFLDYSGEKFAKRASLTAKFGRVLSETPERVDHWNGQTYAYIFRILIPRFVWPNKPIHNLGQKFGHTYGFLDPHNTWTSINLPFLIEAYINFGTMGVVCIALLFGYVYSSVVYAYNYPGAPSGTIVIGSIMLSQLVAVETDLSLIFSGLIYRILILHAGYHFLVSRKK